MARADNAEFADEDLVRIVAKLPEAAHAQKCAKCVHPVADYGERKPLCLAMGVVADRTRRTKSDSGCC